MTKCRTFRRRELPVSSDDMNEFRMWERSQCLLSYRAMFARGPCRYDTNTDRWRSVNGPTSHGNGSSSRPDESLRNGIHATRPVFSFHCNIVYCYFIRTRTGPPDRDKPDEDDDAVINADNRDGTFSADVLSFRSRDIIGTFRRLVSRRLVIRQTSRTFYGRSPVTTVCNVYDRGDFDTVWRTGFADDLPWVKTLFTGRLEKSFSRITRSVDRDSWSTRGYFHHSLAVVPCTARLASFSLPATRHSTRKMCGRKSYPMPLDKT